MTEQHDNQTTNILSGMAALFEENRKQRLAELAGIRSELAHVAQQAEQMRATHSGNIERLSDRMHEGVEVSNEHYTEIMMEINGLKETVEILERRLQDLEALKQDELIARQLNDIGDQTP